jgi:hypothetical protein
MSTTPNLLIGLIGSNQASKEITANTAIIDLELALTNQLTHAMTDANYTLADPTQARQNMVFVFTGTLTAGRNIIIPSAPKLYIISNQTTGGHALTIMTAIASPPGSTVAVSNTGSPSPFTPNSYKLLYCDGNNVVVVG